MPFATNTSFTWPRPPAGQEITITWSYADVDSVDKALLNGGPGVYVSPGGAKLTFGGYPDFSGTISDASMRDVIRNAFNAWDSHSGVKFVEVADSVNADIRVGLYGTGGGLVNAGESAYGHIDMWKGSDFHKVAIELNPNALVSPERLFNTAVHEIGHALGLDDTSGLLASSAPDAMNPTALATQLSADDIKGIQSLYGSGPAKAAYTTDTGGAALLLFNVINGKTPDSAGLDSLAATAKTLIDQAGGNANASWQQLGASLIDSKFNANYQAKYGSLSNTDLIKALSQEIFGSAPSDFAQGYFQNLVDYYKVYYSKFADSNDPTGLLRAKGTLIGDMLKQAVDAHVGKYPAAEAAFLTAASNGTAVYGGDLFPTTKLALAGAADSLPADWHLI